MEVSTTIEKLREAIYEGLNNLDYAMSNEEIEQITELILKEV